MDCISSESPPGTPTASDPGLGRGPAGDLRSGGQRWRSLEALTEDQAAAAPLLGARHLSLKDSVQLEKEAAELGFLQSIAALFSSQPRKSLSRL